MNQDNNHFNNTACVVILYYPDSNVIKNVLSYSSQFTDLWIIDNSENNDPKIKNYFNAIANIHYYHDGENLGIAKRINEACNLALEKGYKWLLTMDQDSSFNSKNLENYNKEFLKISNSEDIAMIGIEYSDDDINSNEYKIEAASHLITSGSLVNLNIAKQLSFFNEKYFIDEVDSEYCFKSLSNGYKILIIRGVYLKHNLGDIKEYRSIKSFTKTKRSIHSPTRIYYMTRNYLDLRKRFRLLFTESFKISDKSFLNRVKNNILYNPNRFKIISMLIKGAYDFKKKKFGKASF